MFKVSKLTLKNFSYLTNAHILILIIGVITSAIWTRYTTVEIYGKYQLVMSFISIVAVLSIPGFSMSAQLSAAKEKQVILPLHPRTKKILENLKLDISNLTIIEPVGYLEIVWLIDNCDFVMTDSGGLQKEAYFFEKQCITLRDETEWVELTKCGANTLVGANKDKILESYRNNSEFNKQNLRLDLYGGGKASENIIKELLA